MKNEKLRAKLNVVIARLIALQKYAVIGFLGLVIVLYGFIVFRINTLSNASPSTTSIDDQVKGAHVPHIDQNIVRQLQSLQDNSVSVKALFDQARANPFQE